MKGVKNGLIVLLSLALSVMAVPAQSMAATSTLRLAVTDIEGLEMIHREFGAFKDLLSDKLGMEPGAFKVIARGPDLPNDVLLAAPHVDPATVAKVKKVFTQYSDELVQAILEGDDNKKYKGMKFIPTVKDADYNYVRAMYRTIGYPKFAAFVE
ncbi:MAG: hypothetical protein JJV98_20930 [Desulfosarcina sp.]|nr:hypothetical protein [Desulfobacterales bacterium]